MAETPVLEATAREGSGKGAARAARRAGFVPAVIYGGGQDPQSINIKFNELIKTLKKGGFLTTLMNVRVDGADNRVVARDVQRDVIKDLPTHVDFLRLTERSRINLMIPVDFLNEEESVGLKRGGVLNIVRRDVELRVRAGAIPDNLTVDLAGLDIGDVVHISDIDLPDGAAPTITDRDFAIATIAAPSGMQTEEETEDGEEGEGAEGAAEDAAEETTEE